MQFMGDNKFTPENNGQRQPNGLWLAEQYYQTYGKDMIHQEFAQYEERIAVGLCGEGSECFGYDDTISMDHDFEAGFCMWLLPEDEEKVGFRLYRAYEKLPKEFMGISKKAQSFGGAGRRGVSTIPEFYERFTGNGGVPETLEQWLYTPEYALACAVNGSVFRDDLGEFSRIRAELKKGLPEDVRRKKIAAKAALMAQAGQYNYMRCLRHGEKGAARIALFQFVQEGIAMVFLLNRRYMPYYKWSFRAIRELQILPDVGRRLETLLESREGEKETAEEIEQICQMIILELKRQGLTGGNWDYLEPHAMEVMERISDGRLRNLHVMDGGA